ncbi:MAG: stage V sporulation protein AD [Clostridiales bacterium]|nr:stage V sporulation protein AD [Clostridiales bacterium]
MKSTIFFKNRPAIIGTSTICGPKESQGNLGEYVETRLDDDTFGEETYEKTECKMLSHVIENSILNSNLSVEDIDCLISGDLLNQIISSSFSARKFDVPYLGIYNACSTMSEAFALSATLVDGGYMQNVISATGSHFSTAERQYRYPLELGSVRPPQSQWTVTGAGSAVISAKKGFYPRITCATIGKVTDFGITDANNMGAAMAPAAFRSLINHFEDTKREPNYYDLIVTGDLGALGSRILKHLTKERGVNIDKNHVDCGELIYNIDEKEFQGGSGAGCSAVVMNSYIYQKLIKKDLNKVLFIATGALLSTLSTQQGESIPAIAHAVAIENGV